MENENIQTVDQDTQTLGDNNQPTETEKTFTQKDVNNIAAREAKSAQEKLLKDLGISDFNSAKEGMQKFQEWQDAQKTEAQKQQEELTKLNDNNANLQNENRTLKAQLSAMKLGVNSESIEDVVALAERQVSDEVTLEDAIKSVIEKYPHFSVETTQSHKPLGKPLPVGGQPQAMTKEKIMAISNAEERHQAIKDNMHLFQ